MPEKKKKARVRGAAVTANGWYSDKFAPDMLCAVLVRSKEAGGTVAGISAPELPEGVFLFTARDVPGKNVVGAEDEPQPVFCSERVSYKGEAAGILVGPDERTLRELAQKINVNVGQKIGATKQKQKKAISRVVKTGVFLTNDVKKIEALFTEADFDIAETWSRESMPSSWTETSGAFCTTGNGIVTVFVPTKNPIALQKLVAVTLGIDEERVIIKTTELFGHEADSEWRVARLACQCALASFLAGKPVKLALSRAEQNAYMGSDMSIFTNLRSAVMNDGKITAMKIDIQVENIFENPNANEILDRLVIAACGVYDIPNVEISASAKESDSAPIFAHPEMIDEKVFFALENHIQKIAEAADIPPMELRLVNICQNAKNSSAPFLFHTENAAIVLERVTSMSDFNRKYASFRIDAKRADTGFLLPTRGIGLAMAFNGSGYYGGNLPHQKQKIAVTLEVDGSVTINSPVLLAPQVVEIWTRTVASMLKVPLSAIALGFDEDESSSNYNDYANVGVMTQMLFQCCREIQKRRETAKEAIKQPLTVKKGLSPATLKVWDAKGFRGSPFFSNSLGSAVAEIEIDPYTYKVRIKSLWLVIDCGQLLVPYLAENSVRLSVEQELSCLVSNDMFRCDNVKITFIESDTAPSQIGGIVHSLVPAAFLSALSQALGICVNVLPCKENTLVPKNLQDNQSNNPQGVEA